MLECILLELFVLPDNEADDDVQKESDNDDSDASLRGSGDEGMDGLAHLAQTRFASESAISNPTRSSTFQDLPPPLPRPTPARSSQDFPSPPLRSTPTSDNSSGESNLATAEVVGNGASPPVIQRVVRSKPSSTAVSKPPKRRRGDA
jgi:hypothetical protein